MILLLAFAFLAGIFTILSPCVLPVLPIILSSTIGGHNTGKSRPIGVVIGFVASFTFFTLFLSTIVNAVGISADLLRGFSIFIIAGFGISLLIPKFQLFLEKIFTTVARFIPQNQSKTGFGGGLLLGFSLGLLWTPCVGPILASVISLTITGTVTLNSFLITFAYSLGTAIPMFLIMLGGQNVLRKVPWLLANTAKIQKVFGVIMILTAIGIFFNIDRTFQTFIIKTFPQYGLGLTKFEENNKVKEQLQNINANQIDQEKIGKPMLDSLTPKANKAPEIIPGGDWFNAPSLKLSELKGKVVIIDFWTYSCINCQRTLPYLKKWYNSYKDKGLVIIGVHAPEFEFEKNKKNVAQAIKDFQLTYPIVQDNDFATWRAYENHYWPAKYFVDKDGFIRYTHFGEGAYDESEKVIQNLLKEAGAKVSEEVNNPTYKVDANTPETYLGYSRLQNFASSEEIQPNQLKTYTIVSNIGVNQVGYNGAWNIMSEYANPQKGAALVLHFEAKKVYLVMRANKNQAKVKVFLDGEVKGGAADNKNGIVITDSDRLYELINLPESGEHLLRLEFEDSNAELYAFTFG